MEAVHFVETYRSFLKQVQPRLESDFCLCHSIVFFYLEEPSPCALKNSPFSLRFDFLKTLLTRCVWLVVRMSFPPTVLFVFPQFAPFLFFMTNRKPNVEFPLDLFRSLPPPGICFFD